MQERVSLRSRCISKKRGICVEGRKEEGPAMHIDDIQGDPKSPPTIDDPREWGKAELNFILPTYQMVVGMVQCHSPVFPYLVRRSGEYGVEITEMPGCSREPCLLLIRRSREANSFLSAFYFQNPSNQCPFSAAGSLPLMSEICVVILTSGVEVEVIFGKSGAMTLG